MPHANGFNEVHQGETIPQMYLNALRQRPQAIALVSEGEQITYQALEQKAWQMARVFKSCGLKRQDTLAYLTSNRAEAVIAFVAAHLLGLKYLTLHPLAALQDHQFVLQDAQVDMLVADGLHYKTRAEDLKSSVKQFLYFDSHEQQAGLIELAKNQDSTPMTVPDDPREINKISYTGGTTGRSKGILHTHRTTVTMVMQMLATYEWPGQPKYLVTTPISHAAGSFLLPVLIKGGTIFLMQKYKPEDFLSLIQAHQINFTFLVPTQIYGLLDHPSINNYDYSSLKLILYGASPIAPTRLIQALKVFGPVFGQIYGQAEAPMTICYLPIEAHNPDYPEQLSSCGRPVIGNQVELFDEQMNPVPLGKIGELCLKSPLVMERYFNRPEENEKVFKGGWLHTGDMAKRDEAGYLYLVDRAKDMIISGGFNVYPSEVEACLAQHPAVALSAVIGVPHKKWGEEVTAIVVAHPHQKAEADELIQFVVEQKGVLHAPKRVVFAEEIPLTAIGKIDKKALRKQFWTEQDRQIS